MKDNLFSQALNYWTEMSSQERKDTLQKFETMNAKLQDRKAREIMLSASKKYSGYFDGKSPNNIFINEKYVNIPSKDPNCYGSAFKNILTIYHEGFHASFYDYKKGLKDLKILSQLDKKQIFDNIVADIIFDYSRLDSCLDDENIPILCYYRHEEQLARKESVLFMLYNLLNICEDSHDCVRLFKIYKTIFDYCHDYQSLLKNLNPEAIKLYDDINQIIASHTGHDSWVKTPEEWINLIKDIDFADKLDKILDSKLQFEDLSLIQKRLFVLLTKDNFSSNVRDVKRIKLANDQQLDFLINYLEYNLKLFSKLQEMLYNTPQKRKTEEEFKTYFENVAPYFNL